MAKRRRRKAFHKKRRNFRRTRTNRDYDNPIYKKWRDEVKERDNKQCQWPGCLSRHRIEVHHIKTWAKHPGLRFVLANGITLCEKCHKSIKGKEHDFEVFFLKVLEWQMLDMIKKYNKKRE